MGFFIDPSTLPGGREWAKACGAAAALNGTAAHTVGDTLACDASGLGGLVQSLTLMAVYGFVLYTASGLIAEGSELLLLVPGLRGIVGSVVLPVLGAIPDGCIVFFSGLGSNAQEEISIGVGALAGSTSMLLTIPWFLSIFAGRVNIRPDGTTNYSRLNGRGRWSKLMPRNNASLKWTGVEPNRMVAISGKIMLATAVSYVIIQIAAFSTGNFMTIRHTTESTKAAAHAERIPAFCCFLVAMTAFLTYLYYQVNSPSEERKEVTMDRVDSIRAREVEAKHISLSAALQDIWVVADNDDPTSSTPLLEPEKQSRMKDLLRVFFRQYDLNNDQHIQASELKRLMIDLGEYPSAEELSYILEKMGADEMSSIKFDSFVKGMGEYIREVNARNRAPADKGSRANGHAEGAAADPATSMEEGEEGEEGEDGEEEVPEDLKHPDSDTQLRMIKRRSFSMMALGTALVLVFSDPMVDVLGDVGARLGVPGFYISFVMAPLASNASELFASYQYAKYKTRKTVTISFSTLLGAAILNNTVRFSAGIGLLTCFPAFFESLAFTDVYSVFVIPPVFSRTSHVFSCCIHFREQFVLAIFMALIVIKGLAWTFTAETISIVFVEICMFYFSQKRVQTLADGYMILALFPVSMMLVAVLENVFGLD